MNLAAHILHEVGELFVIAVLLIEVIVIAGLLAGTF
jgi:hypothetical protein